MIDKEEIEGYAGRGNSGWSHCACLHTVNNGSQRDASHIRPYSTAQVSGQPVYMLKLTDGRYSFGFCVPRSRHPIPPEFLEMEEPLTFATEEELLLYLRMVR